MGSRPFVDRIRKLVCDRPKNREIPALKARRDRPELDDIIEAVAEATGEDRSRWTAGRRSDGTARAMAAYLARRCFGYGAKQVAEALGYTSHTSVLRASERLESTSPKVARTVKCVLRQLANH